MAEEKTLAEMLYWEKMARNADEQQALIQRGLRFLDTFEKPSVATQAVLFSDYLKSKEVGHVKIHSLGVIGNAEGGFTFGALVEDEDGSLREVDADRLKILR